MSLEYKPLKALEKTPVVGGFNIEIVVYAVIAIFLFLILVFQNIFFGLLFLVIAALFFVAKLKFTKKGEFVAFLLNKSASKHIYMNKSIVHLLQPKNNKN
jgi:type IV secretory pathway VirB3-like protein